MKDLVDEEEDDDDIEQNYKSTLYSNNAINGNGNNINVHQHFERSIENSCTVRHDVANLARRENLAKLDFEATKSSLQRRADNHHVRHNGGGGGGIGVAESPITCSPLSAVSSPDDSFMDDEGMKWNFLLATTYVF